jgi:DNA replication and repair protein RecF
MYLTHLNLTNFKNYARLSLELTTGTLVVHGANAQGKTNFLEAIYYLATTRSISPQTDAQLMNWVAQQSELPYTRILAHAKRTSKPDETQQFEVVMSREGASSTPHHTAERRGPYALSRDTGEGGGGARLRKVLKFNNVTQRASDWAGKLLVVLFTPTDLELVTGAPSLRRQYLDHAISQLDAKYGEALSLYTKVLAQRNQHLKQLQERGGDVKSVHLWDDQLVTHGTYLVLQRQMVVTKLDELIQVIHPQLTRERLRLLYRPNLDVGSQLNYQLPLTMGGDFSATFHQPELDTGDVAAHFYARLQEGEARELAQGITLAGPHRDELRFLVDGIDMNIYGSRGQQRSAALALKLAELELLRAQTGEQPILLLDDVLSELDAARRRYLIQRIDAHEQTMLTTTDLAEYMGQFTRPARVLRVDAGIMTRAEGSEGMMIRP